MSRFLFVVPPFVSHVNPTIAIARVLAQRGHAVAWSGHEGLREHLPGSASLFSITASVDLHVLHTLRAQAGVPWLGGAKVLFEQILIPLAHDMLPHVERAIGEFEPDVVIADQQAIAGALAARRMGVRWATSAPTAALLDDSLDAYPHVKQWIAGLFHRLQCDAGLEAVEWPDRSPELVLLYVSRLYAGLHRSYPAHYRFVGPAVEGRIEKASFPWDALRSMPRVFASLGAQFVGRGARFFDALVEALADAPLQVIVSAPDGLLDRVPDNFIVRPWVPVLSLLPHVDAVVSHAGTTLIEALLHGLPAVAAPIAHDQGYFASRAVALGTAVRVRFNRVTSAELRGGVETILDDVRYRNAALRVQQSFREAGGAMAAAQALEQLT